MLIQFKLKNFLSFKDEQVFSMVASNKLTELPTNKIEVEKDHFYLLKSASIFGANASGKSNLLAGVAMMKTLILNSLKDVQDEVDFSHLSFALNRKTQQEPIEFELTFLLDDEIIRYGFKVKTNEVVSEWLLIEEEAIFQREKQDLLFFNHDYFSEEEVKIKFNMTNKRALFLTVLSSTNTTFAEKITIYLRDNVNMIQSRHLSGVDFTKNALKKHDKSMKKKLLEMMKIADLHIQNMEVIKTNDLLLSDIEKKELPKEFIEQLELNANRLITKHHVYDDEGKVVGTHGFDAEIFESSGTNEFIKIAGPIIDTLENGRVLFIDEMDAELHPLMTRYLLSLFNHSKNNNAQLIMTTHNATVLGNKELRRDQIWFTEKDSVEASHLTSLANYRFKGEVVRSDERYDKNYLKGKYGAIPIIKSNWVDSLISEDLEDLYE